MKLKNVFCTATVVFGAVCVLSGCTKQMDDYYNNQLKPEVTEYDYHQIWDFFFGYELPNRRQAEENQLKQLCMHEDSEKRVVTVNGRNDQMYYQRCTLSAYPDPNQQPERFQMPTSKPAAERAAPPRALFTRP